MLENIQFDKKYFEDLMSSRSKKIKLLDFSNTDGLYADIYLNIDNRESMMRHNAQKLQDGVILVQDFNFNHVIEMFSEWEEDVSKSYSCVMYNENYYSTYGVADNLQQVLDYGKCFIESNDKYFLVLVPVIRLNQPKEGGWRWHKWGDYIGKYDRRCEYLYDEEGIEIVYVFHFYAIKKKSDEETENE